MTRSYIIVIRRVNPDTGPEVTWDGKHYPTKLDATLAGITSGLAHDFNLGCVENGRLTWFGCLHHEIRSDRKSTAQLIGLAS